MMKTVKKIFAVLLAVGLLFSAAPLLALPGVGLTARAATVVETGACGSGSHYDEGTGEWIDTTVTYTLYSDGLLTINGEGWIWDYEDNMVVIDEQSQVISTTSPFLNRTDIKKVVIGEGVEGIGNNAFFGCAELTSLTFTEDVLSIGTLAFYGCKKLAAIPADNAIAEIGDGAFYGCESLTSVTLPGHYFEHDGVVPPRIGKRAFYDCTALRQLNFRTNRSSLGAEAFHHTAWYDAQPDGVVYFSGSSADGYRYAYAYKGDMPENTKLTLADGTREIVDEAFASCVDLTEIVLPDSLCEIGDRAFAGCAGLERISLPERIDVGKGIFAGCTALESITVREGEGYTYSDNPFRSEGNCLIDSNGIIVAGCRNSVIPDDGSVKAIASHAFEGPWLDASAVRFQAEEEAVEKAWIEEGIPSLEEPYLAGELTDIQVYAFQLSFEISCYPSRYFEYAHREGLIGEAEYQYLSAALAELTAWLEDVKSGTVTYNSFEEIEEAFMLRYEELQEPFSAIFSAVSSSLSGKKWETVVIPEGIQAIGTAAFDQAGVKNIVIPQSVKSIGLFDGHYDHLLGDDFWDWFDGADGWVDDYKDYWPALGDSLKNVYFAGTEEELIDIASHSNAYDWGDWSKRWLGDDVTIHYNFDINNCPHDATTVKNPVAATCTTQGYTGDICCAICGKKLASGDAVPTKAHLLKQTDAVAPTCTAPGYEAYQTCVVCGGIFDESGAPVTEDRLFVSELGHTPPDENGCCRRCGEQIKTDEPDGEVCPQCGKVHGNDLMGRLLSFFHRILYFFTHLLGR